ncbi:hypothetical protein E4U09_005854, partial [Claviceps aff. purpurea]
MPAGSLWPLVDATVELNRKMKLDNRQSMKDNGSWIMNVGRDDAKRQVERSGL